MPPLAPMNKRASSMTSAQRSAVRSETSRTASAVKSNCPLPDKERGALEAAIKKIGTNLGRCMEVAEITTTNTGQFQVTLRFCAPKSTSLDSQRAGANSAPGAMAEAKKQMNSRALRVQAQSLAFIMKGNGAWTLGPRPLTFLSERKFTCLKAPKPVSSSERQQLYLKGPLPNTPVARAIVGAMCRAVDAGGPISQTVAEELATLSEIPKLPGQIANAVRTPSLEEAMAAALKLPPPNDADNPLANGCGPGDNWLLNFVIPDYPLDFPFNSACNTHDVNYSTLGVTKEEADIVFLDDLLKVCRKVAPGQNAIQPVLNSMTDHYWCVELAKFYYESVKEYGGDAYKNGQRDALMRVERGNE